MVVKIYFDEKKLLSDCQAYVIGHIPEIATDGFIDKITNVAMESIKSTIKITTKKGEDVNVIGEETL